MKDMQERGASPIEPLNRQSSLGERAYERLRDSIVGGQFQPGSKLTVRSVAEALGVSTTPARDAINRLIADGALINRGPKTVVVPELTMDGLDEVTKIRLNLEGLAAFEAVSQVRERDIEFLNATQDDLNAAMDDGRYSDVLKLNKAFHFRIYDLSAMPRLVAMIESLWMRIGPTLNKLYPEYAVARRGAANHQWAIRGLQDRDGQTVKAAIENDLRDGYRRLSCVVKK
ncbi:MAG: GntR family transcriptional regulator [Kiloniellales bacterium]|nr:GntR family transcriptional regulator [Kiloniellales bacterium]